MSTVIETHIGRKASFKGDKGIMRYVEETECAEGACVGVELASAEGFRVRVRLGLGLGLASVFG